MHMVATVCTTSTCLACHILIENDFLDDNYYSY